MVIKLQIFMIKKIPSADSNYIYLAFITMGSALKKDVNCYLKLFLKKGKYIEKKLICILMIICVIFLLLMSLMENKLELVFF